jgi:hypothetical protein
MATAGIAITVDWGSEHSVNAATPALKQIKRLDFIVLSFLFRLIRSLLRSVSVFVRVSRRAEVKLD